MGFKNPYLFAALVQCISTSMILLSKVAYNRGMNISIIVFYRQLVGALFMIPLALAFEWKSAAHSMDFCTFFKIFAVSFIGVTFSMNLYGLGLKFTSSTVSAAAINSVPVTTLVFAAVLRMEKLEVRKRVGMAKILGMVLCTGGVVLLAFYKGPHFKSPFKHHPFNLSSHKAGHHGNQAGSSSSSTWLIGCLFLFISVSAWSLGLVLQGKILEKYPSKLTFTTVICFSSAIQSLFVAIAVDRDPSQWRLAFDFKLLVIIFCGTMGTGMLYYLQVLVIHMKGPVFLAMSTPLSLIITIICSMVLLGESITLASILGGLLLVGSLYSVLWAKRTEEQQKVAAGAQITPMV